MKASYGFAILVAIAIAITHWSCSRPKEIKPIIIVLSSDRPIAAAPNIKIPTYILQIAKLIEFDDMVYQPVLYLHRSDLNERMIKIDIEKSFLNEIRNSLGIRSSKIIIDDYSNIDNLRTTDYYSKPGKFNKPLSTIEQNNYRFSFKAACSNFNNDIIHVNDLISRMILIIKENQCFDKTDTIFITHLWDSSDGTKSNSPNYCSENFNNLKRYYESNKTITIESKLYDLKQLLKDPQNGSDYCIYLEIATYYNHLGGLKRNQTELDESLNYLEKSKIVANNNNKLDYFHNDLDKRLKSGFFQNNSWLNNSMINRFDRIKTRLSY